MRSTSPSSLSALCSAPIRAVLFDKDGTLLDFQATWLPVIETVCRLAAAGDEALSRRIAETCGVDHATGHVMPDSLFASCGTHEIAEGFIAAGCQLELDALIPMLDQHFQAAAHAAVPVVELRPFFERLRTRGLSLGIASSDSEVAIRATLQRFTCGDLVPFVSGYDSGHGLKPSSGMLLAFADATGIPPGEIAVVGDSLHDMQMAERGGAGLRIAVLNGTGRPEALAKAAHRCIPSIAELETVLPAAHR
jgi:phosphoglycolate phosphatase